MHAGDGLSIRHVAAGYGSVRVVNDVTIGVPHGSIVLLVGRNGSGKSTLLKAIFGLVRVSAGSILFDGVDVTATDVSGRIVRGIRYIPQNGGSFPGMTVRENLALAGFLLDRREAARQFEAVIAATPDLEALLRRPAYQLSGGQQRRLAIAMGLMTAPRCLLVDEPSAGLSPQLVRAALLGLREIRDRLNTSVLLVEQNIRAACEVADEVYLLRDGVVAWQGGSSALIAQPALAQFL